MADAVDIRDGGGGFGSRLANDHAPLVEMARVLVGAGATELSSMRAAVVLARGGGQDEALAEIVLAADNDSDRGEVFLPEMLISRVNGGGGNRTRVSVPADSPLSSENASGSSDDDPSPPLVAPGQAG